MLELIGGLLLTSVVPGLVTNRVDSGLCRALVGIRNQIWKPTPENHDLQRALLEALRDGLETTTRRGLKTLSWPEKRQVEEWLKRQTQAINQEIAAVRRGEGSSLGSEGDWIVLLRATPEELEAMGQRQINGQLRQLKAALEEQFQLDTLPPSFRDEFEAEWLPWVTLYLAEAIKTNPRVAEILEVNLLLEIQAGVQQLTEALSNPQQFLGSVQLIDFNVDELRAELADWRKVLTGRFDALQGQIGSGFEDTQRQMEDMNRQLQQQLDQVLAVLGRMQGAAPKLVSTNVITVPPNLEHWLGREAEMAQILAWVADPAVDTLGVQGLGGVGKSALVARIFDQSSGFAAKFWADVSQQPSFEAFAEQALTMLGGYSAAQLAQIDATELTNQLLAILNQRRCLLVIDNLETLLDGSRQWVDAAYGQFFERWVAQGKTSLVMMTTQEKPALFQAEPCWLGLQGMSAATGGHLLQELGIQGAAADLEAFAAAVDGHPLTLYLVAGFLREYCEAQLSRASELGLTEFGQLADAAVGSHRSQREVRRAWILQQHLDRLSPDLREFLLRLSVYRQPFDRTAAAFMLGEGSAPADPLQTQQQLQELLNRSLLIKTEAGQYQFLPFVAAYLGQQLTDPATAHQRAVAYYQSIAQPPTTWQTLPDIAPQLEMVYHHLAQDNLGQAYDTLISLWTFLNLRGHYALWAELYGQLLAEFERRPDPNPDDQEKMGWLLTGLQEAFWNQGQFKSSLSYSKRLLDLSRTIGNRQLEASALLGLGNAHNSLGQYQKALKYYEQRLIISQEISDIENKTSALIGLGNCYFNLSQPSKALGYYEQSLTLARELGKAQAESLSLSGLGNCYWSLSNYPKAIEYYERSLALARDIGDRRAEASALGNLGNAHNSLSQYVKAIDYLEQDLTICGEIGNRSGEATALGCLGNAYQGLSQYVKAIECYEQELALVRDIGDRREEASALGNLGNAHNSLSQYAKAIDYLEQDLTITREIGNRKGEGVALNNLGSAYSNLGQYAKAIECYEQRLAIAREIGDRKGEAAGLGNLGNVYNALSQYSKAIEYREQQLTIAREIGDRSQESSALGGLGKTCENLSQYAKALEYYEQQLTIAREIGNRSLTSDALSYLGDTYERLGQYLKAIEYYEQQLETTREIGNRAGEAQALRGFGNAYYRLSQYAKALEYYEQWLVIAREIRNRSGEAGALWGLGNIYSHLGQYAKAIEYYEQHLVIAREIGDYSGEAGAYSGLGSVYMGLSQFPKAIEYFEKWLVISQEIGNRNGEGSALGNLGDVYNNLGQYSKAIEYHEKALEIAQKISDRGGEARTFAGLGNDYNGLNQYEKAIEYYEQYLSACRDLGDRAGEGTALGALGNAYNSLKQYSKAIEYAIQSLEIAREIDYRVGEASALGKLGMSYYGLNEYQKAYDFSQQSLTTFQAIGNQFLATFYGHYYSGRALAKLGKRREAVALLYQAYHTFRQLGTSQYVTFAWQEISRLGEAYAKDKDIPGAAELYQSQLEALEKIGDEAGKGWVFQTLGKLYYNQADYPRALEQFQQMRTIAQTHQDAAMEDLALAWMGCSHREAKQPEPAIECLEQRLTLATAQNNRSAQTETLKWLIPLWKEKQQWTTCLEGYQTLLALAKELSDQAAEQSHQYDLGCLCFDTLEQPDQALGHFQTALQLATDLQQPITQANAHLMLGKTQNKLGNLALALDHYQQAKALYDSTEGNTTWANTCEEWIQYLQKRLG